MNNGKLDNELNLALSIPEGKREETENLDVGYDSSDNTWELIVRYNGSLDRIRETLPVTIVELTGGYAIITAPQSYIDALSDFEEIEFIEKPKRLEFAVNEGIAVSCILPVTQPATSPSQTALNLQGQGVLVAILDSGADYTHPDFRNPDGTTRITALWDQTVAGDAASPPEGFSRGHLYTREEINLALSAPDRASMLELVPSTDLSGHGTHVLGIAAGNGRASGGRYTGVAPQSDLLVVKLGDSIGNSFPRTTNLMTGLDFILKTAIARKQPVAVNISFGNNYGSHSGSSLVESFLSDIAGQWKNVICIGTGNEGSTGNHSSGFLSSGTDTLIELAISPYETSLNIQIWKNYFDVFDIELISPGGRSAGTISAILGTNQFRLENTDVYLYYGQPLPYNPLQEIYIDLIPFSSSYIDSGIWQIRLVPRQIITGEYDLWIPGTSSNPMTRFLQPDEFTTLTIPSTSPKAIAVGAYDGYTDSYAAFSGRGYTRNNQFIKPDLVAPGVNITSCAPGGGYTSRTGTSMATPFVTGSAALMMEWGIIRGNDPYLYGEKVRAYLHKGARHLPSETIYPNPLFGWGALCLKDSFP